MTRKLFAAALIASLALGACHKSDREDRRERRAERERELGAQPAVVNGAAPALDDREARRAERRARRARRDGSSESYGAAPTAAAAPPAGARTTGTLDNSAPMNPDQR